MYMDTRANLGYWATDNCCAKWSLRTGTLVIGSLTMLYQGTLLALGVMAAISCPIAPSNDTESDSERVKRMIFEEVVEEDNESNSTPLVVNCSVIVSPMLPSANATLNFTVVECPFFPKPEMESLGVTDLYTFLLVVSIFIAYCSIYFILSFCVVLGAIKRTPHLVHGWVAFTTFHMILIVADLLYTLAFTTLIHMCTSIALFVVVLYTWAVVKSYVNLLRAEKKQISASSANLKDDTTDYTVNGVDIEEIPVQV